jgi:hypothetical protein
MVLPSSVRPIPIIVILSVAKDPLLASLFSVLSVSLCLALEIFALPTLNSSLSCVPNSFTIRTYAKRACNPCRMRSFKTQDLKLFRMRSSEKNGWGPRGTDFSLCSRLLRRTYLRNTQESVQSLSVHGFTLFHAPNEVN